MLLEHGVSDFEKRVKRVERKKQDILNRKLIFIFLPLVYEKYMRDFVLFGAYYLHFKMRTNAFVACFIEERAIFCFSALERSLRNALLFFYHFISRMPRSCILLINGIRNNFSVKDVFEYSRTQLPFTYLLTWFPGFLSNYVCVKRSHYVRFRLMLRKKGLTQHQITLAKFLRADYVTFHQSGLFWRFPGMVFFFKTTKFYKGAADEANGLRIPSVGLIDVDTMAWMKLPYFIPWNSNHIRPVKIFLQLVSETLLRGFFLNLFHHRLGEYILMRRPEYGKPVVSKEEKLRRHDPEEFRRLARRLANSRYRQVWRENNFTTYNVRLLFTKGARGKSEMLVRFARYFLAYNRNFIKNNPLLGFKRFGKRGSLVRLSFLHLFLLKRFIYYNFSSLDDEVDFRDDFLELKALAVSKFEIK